jgi:Zn-dependent protease
MVTILVFAAWIFSLCLHEFSHAIVAYWGGDTSVKDKGYLTFNPLRYADPLLSIVYPLLFLLIGGIGLPGGCVYIERDRLRGRGWDCAVSLAGPMSNAVLAVALSTPFMFGWVDLNSKNWFWAAYAFVIELQICAVYFNMLPVPPLDGFGAIAPWLPRDTRAKLYAKSQIGMWLTFIVFWYVPVVRDTFWMLVYATVAFLGVPPKLGDEGYRLFRIW